MASEDDVAFNGAYSAFKFAGTPQQRAAASLLLRAELERKALSLDAALKREKAARTEEFARELALLEEQLRIDIKAKDDAAAVKHAVLELCQCKIDSDPGEANLYCNIVLSWARESTPDKCMGGFLDEMIQEWETIRSGRLAVYGPVRRGVVRFVKMTPEELYRVSANVQATLKKKGTSIPLKDLSEAVAGSVRMEQARTAEIKFWKEVMGWANGAAGLVGTALTTVEAVKKVPMNCDVEMEPLLNCRHYLPEGWFF